MTRAEEEERRLTIRAVEAIEQAASSLAHIAEMLMEFEKSSERWEPEGYEGK